MQSRFFKNLSNYEANLTIHFVKCIAFLVFLFAHVQVIAQYQVFSATPLKGDVASTSIFEMAGDSASPTAHLIDKRVFDATGRILREAYYPDYHSLGRTPRMKLHQYKTNQEITYTCNCSDIDAFVSAFTIKKPKESSSSGGMTDNPPTSSVIIETFSNTGKTASIAAYSGYGYLRSEVRYVYDTNDSLVSRTKYTSEGEVKNQYLYSFLSDSVYEVTQTSYYESFKRDTIKQVYRYTNNELTSETTFVNGRLKYKHNYEPDTSSTTDEGAKRQYDSKGNLSQLTYFMEDGTINVEYFFEYDVRNNWVKLREMRRITHYDLEKKKTLQIRERKYVREVNYLE